MEDQFDLYFEGLWCKKGQTDRQLDLGLSRKRKECRFCAPNQGGKLVCNNHYDREDICSTFLLDYELSRGKTESWIIRQMIYTAVLCPVSANCKQVRETITFEFFCGMVPNFC